MVAVHAPAADLQRSHTQALLWSIGVPRRDCLQQAQQRFAESSEEAGIVSSLRLLQAVPNLRYDRQALGVRFTCEKRSTH